MTSTTEARPRAASFAGRKFLSFQLAEEQYGIDILRVREILAVVDVTALPNTPSHVLGVVNLRGRIIPVVDLRQKFGMQAAEFGAETCIVVVEGGGGNDGESAFRVGCIVDSVREVLTVEPERCEGPPRCASGAGAYIAGLAKLEDRVLILLDIARVIGDVDPAGLPEAGCA